VVLEADLPAEAYEALVALDLSVFRQGPVHYDRQRGRGARSSTSGNSVRAESAQAQGVGHPPAVKLIVKPGCGDLTCPLV
jgi:hypothetical protein